MVLKLLVSRRLTTRPRIVYAVHFVFTLDQRSETLTVNPMAILRNQIKRFGIGYHTNIMFQCMTLYAIVERCIWYTMVYSYMLVMVRVL